MAVTATIGAAAGTGAPAAVVANSPAASRDDGATIFCGTGTSLGSGVFLTVTLASNYSGTTVDAMAQPRVFLSVVYPSVAAAAGGLFVSSVTPRQVVISAVAASASGLLANSTGIIVYLKVEQ